MWAHRTTCAGVLRTDRPDTVQAYDLGPRACQEVEDRALLLKFFDKACV
jgi:hypothetical protein